MATHTRPRGEAPAARTDPLLDVRTRIPRARFPVLPRPRVDALLSGAVRRRVTLVHAIAGAGKTTACASWAASAAGYDVAWLRLDPADDAVRLCAALRAALAGTGAPWAAGLPRAGAGPARFAAGVASAVAGAPRPVVLIVDGADVLDAGRLAPLDQLIHDAPSSLRLVLTARRRPALHLARHMVGAELSVIDSADLACDSAELDAYLGTYGGPAGQDAGELLARTDGWFAMVRLRTGREPVTGMSEYIEEEVLDGRGDDVTAFLTHLAMLGHATPALAGYLLGAARLPEPPATLAADGLLVADPGGLRCRAPLADVLTAAPHGLASATRARLLGEAARWYAAHGHPFTALRTALDGADTGTVGEVLTETGLRAVATVGPARVEALLDASYPVAHSADHPVTRAGANPSGGSAAGSAPRPSVDPAVALVRAAARVFAGDEPAARRYLAAARAGSGEARLRVKCATLDMLLGDEPGAVPAEPTAADGEYAYVTGLRRLEAGALRAAADAFDSAANLLHGSPQLAAHARGWSALALAWHGDLNDADRQMASCAGDDRPWPLTLARAWVCLERDDARGAEAELRGHSARPAGVVFPREPDADMLGGIARVRVAIAHGELGAARELLDRLPVRGGCAEELRTALDVEFAHRAGDPALARRLAGELARRTGVIIVADPPDAIDAADAPTVPALPRTTPAVAAALRILLARTLLQADEPRAALNAVATLIVEPPDAGDASTASDAVLVPADVGATGRVGALAVAAAACGRLRATEDAARLLTDALALAAAEAAYAALLACGQPLRALATVFQPGDAEHDRVRRELLRRFDLRPAARQEPPAMVGDEPLTRAELSVLRFLSSHMTNTEIAESLVVSVNTVKTHLRSIYRKLDVSTRRDALRTADRLGLL